MCSSPSSPRAHALATTACGLNQARLLVVVRCRDNFYRSLSYRGWGGASGYDSVIIAYDALLGARSDWVKALGGGDSAQQCILVHPAWSALSCTIVVQNELCMRAVLHGGDNDSTGTIAGAWYGAAYGLSKVPKCNYEHMEGITTSRRLGSALYKLQQ